jgi:hypothetical protein
MLISKIHSIMKKFIFFLLTFYACWQSSAFSQRIDLGTLLDEMTDLERLAEVSDPPYRTIQFSSYDRRSTKTSEPGWFANADGFGNEPIPGFRQVLKSPGEDRIGEYLICDVTGPGAIVRLWTARIEGKIRMYLNGNAEPVYDGPAQDFFIHLPDMLANSGDEQIYTPTFLQYLASYFPVPFSEGCRIVWTGDLKKLHFYHVGMRIYPPGTDVKTFEINDLHSFKSRINRVSRIFGKNENQPGGISSGDQSFQAAVKKGSRMDVFTGEGEKLIEYFRVKVSASHMDDALRKNILNIYFDDASIPQVQAPLGDFFGTAPGLNLYGSLPFSVMEDSSLACRYPMPFRKSVRMEIVNLSGEDIMLTGSIALNEYEWKAGRSMYFHAHWRRDVDLVSSEHRIRDLPFLLAIGQGRIVGTAVHVYNPSHVPSSWGNWWGEGDEKIFIDRDTFPSFFGTGSEDYFNYAWSSDRYFSLPYCGQTRNDGPGNRGYVSNYRWHILDDIPFRENMAFYMELFSHDEVEHLSYARMIYLYGRPGLVNDHMDIPADPLRNDTHPVWIPVGEKGSAGYVFREAEELIKMKYQGIELERGYMWSQGSLLVWKPEEKGNTIQFLLQGLKNLMDNELQITLRHGPGGGAVRFSINDSPVKIDQDEALDLYDQQRVYLKTHQLEKKVLKDGMNSITLEFAGEPGRKLVGIDFIWLRE